MRPATIIDVRRRRPKRRWLRWLLLLIVIDAAAFYWWWNNQVERRYNGIIRDAAAEFGVEYALIKAVIWQESRFDEKAVGQAGEIGLMQLMELAAFEWADEHGVHDFEHAHVFDPRTNILAGTYYLKTRLARYPRADDHLPYALADYNAGRAHVLRWAKEAARTNSALFLQNMDYPGTRRYIDQVTQRRDHYR